MGAGERGGLDADLGGRWASVEVDGVRLDMDRREAMDVRTMRVVARIQADYSRDGKVAADTFAELFLLMERVFSDESLEKVEGRLRADNGGYAPADEYVRILESAFGQVRETKN